MRIIEFVFNLGLILLETSDRFFDFLLTSFTIGNQTFAIYELMFGSGFVLVLGYILASWVIDILP